MAADRAKVLELSVLLDPFGDHAKTEVLSEADHGADLRPLRAGGTDRRHKAPVDLHRVHGEAAQVGEGRVPGAEVGM